MTRTRTRTRTRGQPYIRSVTYLYRRRPRAGKAAFLCSKSQPPAQPSRPRLLAQTIMPRRRESIHLGPGAFVIELFHGDSDELDSNLPEGLEGEVDDPELCEVDELPNRENDEADSNSNESMAYVIDDEADETLLEPRRDKAVELILWVSLLAVPHLQTVRLASTASTTALYNVVSELTGLHPRSRVLRLVCGDGEYIQHGNVGTCMDDPRYGLVSGSLIMQGACFVFFMPSL